MLYIVAMEKDDSIGYYISLALFSVAIPVIFAVAAWLTPGTQVKQGAPAAPAAAQQ